MMNWNKTRSANAKRPSSSLVLLLSKMVERTEPNASVITKLNIFNCERVRFREMRGKTIRPT